MKRYSTGLIGLAVMGENLARNMASKGFSVAAFDIDSTVVDAFNQKNQAHQGLCAFPRLDEMVNALEAPRKILIMIKAGEPVDSVLAQLMPLLDSGDIVIDGGNSHFSDTRRRCLLMEENGFHFVGAGISGGESGALAGPSIMPGGSREAWPHLQDLLTAISARAADQSPCCAWMGPDGAGHFVKMVHNGIEYGDMQIICEAYHLMKSVLGMTADGIHGVFKQWNSQDLSSYLIEITADIFACRDDDGSPLVEKILDVAGQKGTGKWTAVAALEAGMPLSLISESVFARCVSSQKELRIDASRSLGKASSTFQGDLGRALESLFDAVYGAKLISYAQGFALLTEASKSFNWKLDCAAIARIWRGGCIIRSAFLDHVAAAFENAVALENILLDPYFTDRINQSQEGLRFVLNIGIHAGIPLPCMSSALNYYDSLRSEWLPANLIQAQRDYFGAHMFERVDEPRGRFFHNNWSGKGGSTTSSVYDK